MTRIYRLTLAALLAGAAGCGTPRVDTAAPPRSPGHDLPAFDGTDQRETVSEPAGPLSLPQALRLALLKNPSLEARHWDVRAAEARTLQAGLPPNPEIEVELEEYDRDGEGMDSSETAVTLGQLIELGGKRRWRQRIAQAEGDLAGWEYEAQRLAVFAETTERFVRVLAAQTRVVLASAAVGLAEQTAAAVRERVNAGKEPALQALKADAEVDRIRITALEAETRLAAARHALAAAWGADEPVFTRAEGQLDAVEPAPPELARLKPLLERNPELALWQARLRLREAALASEKAGRVPDIELSAGLQGFKEDDTDAMAVGVGLSLPLFDRNQGTVAAARHDLARARAEHRAARNVLMSELLEIHAALVVSRAAAVVLDKKVVPAQTRAFEAACEGYRQGKFGFLDVLDSQRTLLEAQRELIDALADCSAAWVALQRITATRLDELTKNQTEEE